jgi:dTDP-4-dehydrorhamnose reductase
MARVLVMGAYGRLGTLLCPALAASGHEVLRQGRSPEADFPADPSDAASLDRLLAQTRPERIVNLVAATDVDRCETDPHGALVANTLVVERLAAALRCTAPGAVHLVHLSTDQVYDGPGPHREDDARPCNVYARSKYAGELAAMSVGATVLRTNFVGASRCEGRPGFSDFIVGSLRAKKAITVFNDVLFNPLHASTLCEAIGRTLERPASGIFNVGSCDGLSKAKFALRLAANLHLDPTPMTVGTSTAVALKARRPLDMRVETRRFEDTFGVVAPSMDVALHLTAKDYPHAAQSQS